MRDGVRIAVDIVLPKGLPPGAWIPSILTMTRYWRAQKGNGAQQLPSLHNASLD